MKDHEDYVDTGSDRWSVVVSHYGNGKGTRDQFANSDPTQLSPTIVKLQNTADFAMSIFDRLEGIEKDLGASWQGKQADDAIQVLELLKNDAVTIHENAAVSAKALDVFENAWQTCRTSASSLGDDDDAGAKKVFDDFTQAQNDALHALPSRIWYHDPLSGQGVGPGGITPPTTPPPPPWNPPKFGGGGVPTVGGPGSHLAGIGGANPGGFGSGLGGGAGIGSGGPGSGAGTGAAGEGAGPGGAGGSGGFLPPFAGAGGAGGNQQDRERSTWLEEDEDVWGGGEAPSSVIT